MMYVFADCELDTRTFELRRHGSVLPVERQVFDVLAYLVEHRDRLVTKEELLDRIWGDRFVSEAALNSRVMAARKAIGDNGRDQRLIKTVHGRGYRFIAPVSARDDAPSGARETRAVGPASVAAQAQEPLPEPPPQDIRIGMAPDGVNIAYAVTGEGPPLVKAANWLSHLEFDWRSPVWRHWLEELARYHRLIRYDPRGTGLSDWEAADVSWEARVRDLETVVEAAGVERFALFGMSGGGALAVAYAARHPERVSHLILYGAYVRGWRKRAKSQDEFEEEEALLTLMKAGWGRDSPTYRQIFASDFIPGATWEHMRWFNDLCRVSASPENAVAFHRTSGDIDVSDLLSQVRVPTLVLHGRGDLVVPFEEGRALAAGISGARFVPLESPNHILLEDEPAWRVFLGEVRAFLGVRDVSEARVGHDHMHAILFTDIEGSTELMSRLGDRAARDLLREYEAIARDAFALQGGREVKALGDGFMATFHSAVRALECAVAIQRRVAERGTAEALRVRIGINAGEPIPERDDLFGSAVNLAARLAAQAEGGTILVCDVVRQLVTGKGFVFEDRGLAVFKGFPEPVRVFELGWRP